MIGRKPRGVAILAVLAVVVLLTAVVVYAITLSQNERRQAGKEIHNTSMQQMTESALQTSRNFFAARFRPLPPLNAARGWDFYLTYFSASANLLQLQTAADVHAYVGKLVNDGLPELIIAAPTGYDCFLFAQNDVDKWPTPDPTRDNNMFIYVGAVCAQIAIGGDTGAPLVTELTGPLIYVPNQNLYRSQSSGGIQGQNNVTVSSGLR